MKIAICYYSRHHGSTLKVLEAMTRGLDADLIDVTGRMAVRLDRYDLVGFASDSCHFAFHQTVVDYARNYLPEGSRTFLVYTCGLEHRGCTGSIRRALADKKASVLGQFSCPGCGIFGPLRLPGGIRRRHPDEADCENARRFLQQLTEKL